MRISRSGFLKSRETAVAWCEVGESARRFVGRCDRGSAEVGIGAGPRSDITSVPDNEVSEK
jgi:hypothetical protein